MKLLNKFKLAGVSSIFSLFCYSQNPVISHKYTADPCGLEYKGRLYIWTSHDLDGQEGYSMNDITCLSTDDMVNWTDHGEVYNVKNVKNVKWTQSTMAPSVVYRNGKFYMYVNGSGSSNIAVAVSDSPTGPFKDALGKPVITKDIPNADVQWCFDPTVLVDDDGKGYCVFGGGSNPDGRNARIIKLGPDLLSTQGDAISIDAPVEFFEGGYLHSRKVKNVKKILLLLFFMERCQSNN